MLENKKILVCGGAGSIGSELVRQLAEKNSVYVLDINETGMFDLVEELRLDGKDVIGRVGDIRDPLVIVEVFNRFNPDLVFQAAACKHVTPMEWNPEEAVKTNVLGTNNVIQSCKTHGCPMIFISTDKVVNAVSVMGMTKKMGEIMTQNAGYVSVRFANVLGSRGSVIPIWQKQIDDGKPLTITHPKMERYFMGISQAVSLVIKAAEIGKPGDTIILDMGKPVKVIDLAKKILAESGSMLGLREIGVRPGEAMSEELMSDEEKGRAIKKDNLWIIRDKKEHARKY